MIEKRKENMRKVGGVLCEKMRWLYWLCAIAVYKDARHLCRENGFREMRSDQLEYALI